MIHREQVEQLKKHIAYQQKILDRFTFTIVRQNKVIAKLRAKLEEAKQ
jgi:uncharacterized coiled-coil protein SlyX